MQPSPVTWRIIRTFTATWPPGTRRHKPYRARRSQGEDCDEHFFAQGFSEGSRNCERCRVCGNQVVGRRSKARAGGAATLFGARAVAEGFRRHAASTRRGRHQGGGGGGVFP